LLLYGPVGDIPFYVLLLSDTNTDSIWLGLMEDTKTSNKSTDLV
jgi:hypothetical protein